jgi:HAE1 family hydrophobic/amphiphilic exporter-1
LISADGERVSPEQLGAIPILAGDGTTTVRLDQVARLVRDTGPARIQRTDRQRVVEVTGGVSGRSLGDVSRDIRAVTKRCHSPRGTACRSAARSSSSSWRSRACCRRCRCRSCLVYMLMVALYESWLTPFAIMFSVPVALVGAFGGLYLTGNTFNIFSLIGMIMLVGLVGKNAILLIDFTDTLRKRGMPRTEALLEAGYTRLRPIIMTTATVVFAMLPLSLKLEEGGESRAPLAVVIIGGVLSSTLLTLLLVPSVYTILDDAKNALGAAIRRVRRRGAPAPAYAHASGRRLLATPPPARGGAED